MANDRAINNLQGPLYNGEDRTITFTVYQSDGTTLRDITGYTVSWKLLKNDAVVATIAGTNNGTTAGTIDVVIPSATTLSMTPGRYTYVLRRTDSSSKDVLQKGEVEMREVPSW